MISANAATAIVANARISPNGWARNAEGISPRTEWLNAVVMPQVGQGMSAAAIHPHEGRPIWRWVPTPSAAGRIQNAARSTAIAPAATRSALPRCDIVLLGSSAGPIVASTSLMTPKGISARPATLLR